MGQPLSRCAECVAHGDNPNDAKPKIKLETVESAPLKGYEPAPEPTPKAGLLSRLDAKLRIIADANIAKLPAPLRWYVNKEVKPKAEVFIERKLSLLPVTPEYYGVATFVVVILLLAVPAIATGSIYAVEHKSMCTSSSPLVTWLLVYAATAGAFVLIGLVLVTCHLTPKENKICSTAGARLSTSATAYLGAAFGLFLFAWFVVGLVWLTGTSIADGCDANLYTATRVFLLSYAMLPFCCFASICSGCCVLCGSAPDVADLEDAVDVAAEGAAAGKT